MFSADLLRLHLCLTMAVLLALASCAATSPAREARHIGLDKIPSLLLQESEAPAGTRQIRSAWAARGQFADGDDELSARWRDLGFEDGWITLFASSTDSTDPTTLTIANGAMVFPTSDAASRALQAHRAVGVPKLTKGSVATQVSGIGDEAFAFTYEHGPLGPPGAICAFRVANVMFLVPGSGIGAKVEELIAIARKIADRALRVAVGPT